MQYFIIVNGQQVGPMPKEQLVNYGLCPTSKVWCEGMPNWADASTVADLQSLLYPYQAPMPQPPYQGGYQQQGYGQQSYNTPPEVSLGDAIKICFNKYADFTGRARRSEFWYWQLFNLIVGFSVGIAVGWIPIIGQIISILVSLAFVIPNYAVGARRLHDTGRSGWWQLLHLTCIGSIILIVWFCEDSHGDNEYGPSPKYPG